MQAANSRTASSRIGGGLTIAVGALALAVAGVAVVLVLGQHGGGKPTKTVRTARTKTVPTGPTATTTKRKLPGPTVEYTGDDYTLRRPTGWTQVSTEVNDGSYIESRWALPSQPTDVAVFIDHTVGVGDITPTEGADPQRDKILGNPNYDELQWSLQEFPAGQGRVWQFIYAGEEEIDTFFVACGTGYGILGKAPATEFSDFQGLFGDVTSSFEPSCG